jgi:hypothetical protein
VEKAIVIEDIKSRIFIIRGKKVIFDKDLAELYGVDTGQLIRQVRRNLKRFPDDFMFSLTKKEFMNLRCQFGISSWGGRRYLPYVFTEQGIAMLSSVLNSKRAIEVNIQIMRAFVSLRRWVLSYESLRRKIEEMEKKYDGNFRIVFTALKELMDPPPEKPKRRIGFHHE